MQSTSQFFNPFSVDLDNWKIINLPSNQIEALSTLASRFFKLEKSFYSENNIKSNFN